MMAKKSERQQNDQFVDLPEDRIDQIGKADSQGKAGKESRRKSSAPRKVKQAKDAGEAAPVSSHPDADGAGQSQEGESKGSKDGPKKAPERPTPSREDLLADIRQELAASEEDVVEQKNFFGRFKDWLKIFSRAKTIADEPQTQPEADIELQEDIPDLVVAPRVIKKRLSSTKQEEKAIQEFFSDLEALANVAPDEAILETVELQESQIAEKEPDEDEKVKAPRLPVKSDDKRDIDFDKVREVALQEYDDTLIEPVVERKVPLQEEVRKTIRESKPFERVVIVAVFVLTIGALLFSGIYIIVKSISLPTPEPTIVVNLEDVVYPTHLNLPGGWGFNLGQGRVTEGQWSPQGAEWLIGTEVSRWVALPWSLQLEAVLRTLKSGDHIELTMNNLDRLEFEVYSIQEMTMEEIQALDAKTPSLLIILFEKEGDSNTHWVVTALP